LAIQGDVPQKETKDGFVAFAMRPWFLSMSKKQFIRRGEASPSLRPPRRAPRACGVLRYPSRVAPKWKQGITGHLRGGTKAERLYRVRTSLCTFVALSLPCRQLATLSAWDARSSMSVAHGRLFRGIRRRYGPPVPFPSAYLRKRAATARNASLPLV